jgi:peptidoglycan/xylan/chitin deacetylase (PgdA/CDA1 family)
LKGLPRLGPRKFIATAAGILALWAAPAAANTTVSLTFTSAIANQYSARQILADHNMHGTFYVNTGRVNQNGRLTWQQVDDLASDGNEIGGQTVNNSFLAGLDPVTLAHQICDDRTTMAQMGFSPTSFAWPHGSADTDAAAINQVQQCGYTSARGDTGLGGTGQPKAESIPPANPYLVRTRGSIDADDTLAEIETWITQANQGVNTWFPIAFANVCDPAQDATCPASHITPQDFDALLDWLQGQQSNGVQVETVRKVMTGSDPPPPPPPPPPPGTDTTVTFSFDDGNADQMPAVQMLADHGMDGTFFIIPGRVDRPNSPYMTWSQVQAIYAAGNEIGGHTQNHLHLPTLPESQQRSEICDGRQALLSRGYPQVSFAYPFGDHDATSERLVQECGYSSGRGVSGLGGAGEPKGESMPPQNRWVIRTRGSVDVNDTLPEIEDWIMDAEALSRSSDAPTSMNLVFHHLCDPAVTNCSDPNGVDDQYMTPSDFDALLDWLQARESSGTEVKTIADMMGASAPPTDSTPPLTQISCDSTACQPGFYNHAVSATLSATDTGGSGLKEIRFTTDGSDPTISSPLYSGSIALNSTTTIKFRAWDNAGNAEVTKSQTVSIDTAKPTSAIKCGAAACSSGFYNANVTVTLSGSDTGGSGLKNIRYTTNGSTPTASSPVYTGPITVSSTSTIRWRAEDNVGNLESIRSQVISIDKVKPTSSIRCNGSTCSSSTYSRPVSVTLSGSDTGGSGLKNLRYTTNGSNPTASSPVYTGPISVSATTTIRFRAEDNAGNVESPIRSQTIRVR